MADNIIDYAGRYVDKLVPSDAGATWQEREQNISREIAAGPDTTVAGFAWHFNDLYTRNIKSLIASGDLAQAKRYYDDVRGAIEANRDDLLAISQVTDTGKIADELASRATNILMSSFDQEQVTMSDGSTVTVGQVLADGSSYLQDKSEELKRLNFSDAATQLYLANDRNIKTIMDPFLRSARGQSGRGDGVDQMTNRLQMQELAEGYADDAERINDIFGTGTARFLDYIRETHKTSGNAAATMRTLVDFADSYSAGTGVTGSDLASTVVNGYNDLLTTVFRGDSANNAKGGKAPVAPEITDEQRRLFDAAFLPAVRAAMDRLGGEAFDLHDLSLRQSMLEIADTVAYTTALGGDLVGASRGAGLALNDMFGDYVAEAMTGQAHMPDNIVTAIRNVRSQLSQRLVGGRDAKEIAVSLTGNDHDYLSNVDKVNGSQSSCPEADGLAAEVHKYLALGLVSGLALGDSPDDVFARLAGDAETLNGVASWLKKSFHGRGRDEASQALASAVVSGLASGERVSIERTVGDLCFGRLSQTLSPAALETLRTWYHGNIASQLQFADQKTALREKYKAEGYTDAQARRAVAMVAEEASRQEAAGKNPMDVYGNAMDVGTYYTYEYVYDQAQNGAQPVQVKDPVTGKPQVQLVRKIGPRSQAAVRYGPDDGDVLEAGSFTSDRARWDNFHAQLEEMYGRIANMSDFADRQTRRLELAKKYKDDNDDKNY